MMQIFHSKINNFGIIKKIQVIFVVSLVLLLFLPTLNPENSNYGSARATNDLIILKDRLIENETKILAGNVFIVPGGNLTLKNVIYIIK